MSLLFLSFGSDLSMPINIDYYVNGGKNEIIIIIGFLLHEIHEYHDLLNPFIMKAEVKYNEDTF